MTLLSADPGHLSTAGASISKAGVDVQDLILALEGGLAGVLSDWKGLAPPEFWRIIDAIKKDAVDIAKNLDELSRLVLHASTNYETTEVSITNAFHG